MLIIQFISNFFLFFFGIIGIVMNRRSILIILMCVEVVLLSLNLNFILASTYLDDLQGQLLAFFVLTVAASESAVGLAIIILYYKLRGDIEMFQTITLKG